MLIVWKRRRQRVSQGRDGFVEADFVFSEVGSGFAGVECEFHANCSACGTSILPQRSDSLCDAAFIGLLRLRSGRSFGSCSQDYDDGGGQEMTCKKCGAEMAFKAKDTFSGDEIREYECPKCGH